MKTHQMDEKEAAATQAHAEALCELIDALDNEDTPAIIAARSKLHSAEAEVLALKWDVHEQQTGYGRASKKKLAALDAAKARVTEANAELDAAIRERSGR